jgi:hypothetical protein
MNDETDLLDQYVQAARERDFGATGLSELFPNLRDAAYALAPKPPIEEVVEGVIDRCTSNLWYGKWGSKKTWAIQYLVVRITQGRPFLGFDTHQGPAIYFDEENGDAELSERFGKCIRGATANQDIPLYYNSLGGINFLKNPNDVTKCIAQIQALGAVLVVFDTLAAIMAGGDENSVRDTQPVFMALRQIAETTKAAVITLHHTGKNDDYRGSSAIPGALNDMVRITSEPTSPYIQFKSEKKRRGKPFEFAAFATWTDDQFYLDETDLSQTTKLSKSQHFVLDCLDECGELSIRNIADKAGDLYTLSTLRKAGQALIEKKLIRRVDAGGAGMEAFYAKT